MKDRQHLSGQKDTPTFLTPAREAASLFRHGTAPQGLSPRNLYDTAVADLRRREANVLLEGQREALRMDGHPKLAGQTGRFSKYAFLAKHVKASKTPVDLISVAGGDRSGGLKSETVDRLRIYSDSGLLDKALRLAKKIEKAEAKESDSALYPGRRKTKTKTKTKTKVKAKTKTKTKVKAKTKAKAKAKAKT